MPIQTTSGFSDTPSLLLFDLGGVLIENAGFERLNCLLPKAIDETSLKERWLYSPTVRSFELGESSPHDFAEKFIAEWALQLSPEAFLKEFMTWPKGFYPDARETIRSLRQKHRVACLSNSNPLHWEKFGGFAEDFDIALSSHLLGAIKPDREAFLLAITACGVEPGNIRFFDDSAANIHAARNQGMQAFHIEGFESLLRVLRSEGLLPG